MFIHVVGLKAPLQILVHFVSGSLFNEFAEWVEWDNNTAIYYETWTVWEKPGMA